MSKNSIIVFTHVGGSSNCNYFLCFAMAFYDSYTYYIDI
jgi:hypothetical protein